MTHIKTAFFLVLCLIAGVLIGQAYLWWTKPQKGMERHDGPPLITGIGDAPALRGFTVTAGSLPSEATLKQWSTAFASTMGIECDASLSAQTLQDAVNLAHSHQLQVVLLPPKLGTGAPTAQDPFPQGLQAVAALAQQAQVDYLCASDLGIVPDTTYWQAKLDAVRQVFKGKIILAARPNVFFGCDIWKLPDLVGIIGPIPLARRLPNAPEDVTLHDMRVAWDCSLTEFESLAKQNGKKLALLRLNIPAEVSARLPDPEAPVVTPAKNPALQRLLYEALLLETKGRTVQTDMLLFHWDAPDAPPNVNGMMGLLGELWDPKNIKPAATAATEPAEEVEAPAETEPL